MVDAEGRGDGADLPVLAVIEAANLGVLLGRDHGASPGTRDGSARAVEGARRFPGHRPCNATRPPGARSAPIRRRVRRQCGERDGALGSLILTRRDTRAGDRDDRGALRDCGDDVGARRDRRAAGGRATRRRAIRVAAITRDADREEPIAASTDFWRSGASTTSERRRASTGHGAQTVAQERRLARSVEASRRSPRAWRSAPGLHLDPPQARQPTAIP